MIRNNVVVDEPYIKESMNYFPQGKVVVPKGYIFVMGNNRNHSSDSRVIGCIPIGHVIGKLLIKL